MNLALAVPPDAPESLGKYVWWGGERFGKSAALCLSPVAAQEEQTKAGRRCFLQGVIFTPHTDAPPPVSRPRTVHFLSLSRRTNTFVLVTPTRTTFFH